MTGIVGVPTDEAETTVQFSRDTDTMNICTSDNTVVTKLRRLLRDFPNDYKLVRISKDSNGNHVFYTLTAPKKLFTFRSPVTGNAEKYAEAGRRLVAQNAARKASTDSTDND